MESMIQKIKSLHPSEISDTLYIGPLKPPESNHPNHPVNFPKHHLDAGVRISEGWWIRVDSGGFKGPKERVSESLLEGRRPEWNFV